MSIDPERVRDQIRRIASSHLFANSPKLVRFLEFTAEQSLAGKAHELKEYLLGVAVYDRDSNYDPKVDSIVRVEAVRLRDKLKRYYQAAGQTDPLLITYPVGKYVPVIEPHTAASALVIAVLPFVNLSSEPENEFLSDGLTEELIRALTHLDGLRVVARTSAFQFKGKALDVRDVGARLNADFVLEGSVRQSGDRLRIAAQLIDVSTGFHVWSQSWERQPQDIFAIQDEITSATLAALRVKFSKPDTTAAPRTAPHVDAFHLYLKGRYLFNKWTVADVRKSFPYYEEALKRNPEYARVWFGLGDSYSILGYWDIEPETNVPHAHEALTKALHLDPNLIEAQSVLAALLGIQQWKWRESERRFYDLLARNPGYADGHHMFAFACAIPLGKLDEARQSVDRALELDPLSLGAHTQIGRILYLQRRYQEAVQRHMTTLDMQYGFREAHWQLGLAYEQLGQFEQALSSFGRALEISAADSPGVWGTLGHCYALMGKDSEAQAMLTRLQHAPEAEGAAGLIGRALIHTALGEDNHALDCLDQASGIRSARVVLLKTDPRFEPVRTTARFHRILERIGITSS